MSCSHWIKWILLDYGKSEFDLESRWYVLLQKVRPDVLVTILELICCGIFTFFFLADSFHSTRKESKYLALRTFLSFWSWLCFTYCLWLVNFVVLPENSPENLSDMNVSEHSSTLDVLRYKLWNRRDWQYFILVGVCCLLLQWRLSAAEAKAESKE